MINFLPLILWTHSALEAAPQQIPSDQGNFYYNTFPETLLKASPEATVSKTLAIIP